MTKRVIDLTSSLVLLVILSPIMILVAISIRATSEGPIVYWSQRVGKNNNLFWMPKFRTMLVSTPQVATHLLKNSGSYLTPIGSFLRKSSLDELPQLWSILRGDMSLVGPRPALFNQNDLIELRTNKKIHMLKPGVTGWAQINGRDELSIEDKVQYDLEYLNKKSIKLDFVILLKTFIKVIQRKGVKH